MAQVLFFDQTEFPAARAGSSRLPIAEIATRLTSPPTPRSSRLRSPGLPHIDRDELDERGRADLHAEAYVCGNEGTLLRITTVGIEYLSLETDEHSWGLTAVFEGQVYVATLSTLYVLEGDELEQVDVGLGHPVDFYRLDSGDGVM